MENVSVVDEQKHLKKFNEYLRGKTVKNVSFLSVSETEDLMWYKRPVVIEFTDGSYIIPQCDDEGNDGGSLYYQDNKTSDVIYVL
jgi:hypothetical protein